MYIPSSFQETDLATLHRFMEQHSFATLVSSDEDGLLASHLPLVLNRAAGDNGFLIGHMARPNPQWENAAGQHVLAIFHGPHAYISPSWYEGRNVVPTWNYATVHAYGVLRVLEDRGRVLDLLERSVEVYEAYMTEPWSMKSVDAEFVERLMDCIVAFEIDIDRLEGKWKLSQNHSAERRNKVIRGLQALGDRDTHEIAAMMTELR